MYLSEQMMPIGEEIDLFRIGKDTNLKTDTCFFPTAKLLLGNVKLLLGKCTPLGNCQTITFWVFNLH